MGVFGNVFGDAGGGLTAGQASVLTNLSNGSLVVQAQLAYPVTADGHTLLSAGTGTGQVNVSGGAVAVSSSGLALLRQVEESGRNISETK